MAGSTLFLLPNIDQTAARHFAHIRHWQAKGHAVTVAGFQRSAGQPVIPGVDLILGRIAHANYLQRIPVYVSALIALRKLQKEVDTVFVYSLDTFFLAFLATIFVRRKVRFVFVVLDVRNIFLAKSLAGKLARRLLIFALKRSELTMVSSGKFVTSFMQDILNFVPDKWIEIENKITFAKPQFAAPDTGPTENDGKIRIGYFGLIRCRRSLEILARLAQKFPDQFLVEVAGIYLDVDAEKAMCGTIRGIRVSGSYRNPEDLPALYQSCDIVWACYPHSPASVGNQNWAKTNRFYEACFFGLPLIVSKGTEDARAVEALKVGLSLNLGDPDAAVRQLSKLNRDTCRAWSEKARNLPSQVYEYTTEFDQLDAALYPS